MTEVGALKALDLFAGTGWGVACQRLGIDEMGVEIMPEAVATREANGMHTIYRDVWDGLTGPALSYDLLIASPPCQTFSLAGKGAGRAALDEVIEAIQLHAYKDPAALKAFGELHDMRTALVLTPLAHVWRDRPRLVTMEQVPTVLPVWEACADVMRGLGYSVKVANLQAEQYGVPQTRKRAILVARLDGEVQLPAPTHSRYYSRTPEKLDAGVKKWVSMAEALGWSAFRSGSLHSEDGLIHFTQNNKQAHQARRSMNQPAPTVTAGHDSGNRGFIDGDSFTVATPDEVAVLQSYPMTFRNGNQANAAKRTEDQPAPTIAFGHNSGRVEWVAGDEATRITVEEAAALQSYPAGRGLTDRPSPTITGGGTEAGGAEPVAKWHERYTGAPGWVGSTARLSTDEAATLQSYPSKPFIWCGTKTKQFLQIGNAVPPLLAQAILTALTADIRVEDPRTLELVSV